ncbi:MAG TPA: HAMP domain-containing sensor histidine kinase [Solirubrobacteraceae bacterium]
MRVPRPGLRARLVLALVATAMVTLVAAVLTLVPPLEHRLAADRVRDMRELARTADLGLARLSRQELRPGAARQERLVRELARRMGGRVALFDAHGVELADTDPERREPRSDTPERLVDAGFARSGDVRDQVLKGEAVVVAPVHTRAGRRTLVLRKSLDDSRAAAAVVRRALPVAGGVALVLALGLGVALGFGLLRRLERLRRGARRLADDGIDRPLVLDAGRDEVGEVAQALETMRARLHAEELGRQAFLSTASHELRTPLASLRGTVELLEEELAGERPDLAGVRTRAAAARRQTERMTALAEDLLDLGRLDADAPLAAEPVELSELAGTVASELVSAAHEHGVALRLDAPTPVWTTGDPRAGARVLRALLDNALRHGGPPGSTVTVAVDAVDGTARVRVVDEGPGVAEADRERIFGRFERGPTRGLGFGLGLALARGLARQMGGDVHACAVDAGACFEATLPTCPAPAGAAEPTSAELSPPASRALARSRA